MNALWPTPFGHQLELRCLMQWQFGATFQIVLVAFYAFQPVLRQSGMNRLAIVRRTGQRNMPIVQSVRLHRPTFDKRDSLQELDGVLLTDTPGSLWPPSTI